jgi:hypothetical protein
MIMRRATILLSLLSFACFAASAAAQQTDEVSFRPYFGAAYEQGWLSFKSDNHYGKQITGFAPIVGVTMGKNFAFEMSWRMAYGDGGSDDPVTLDTTTDKAALHTVSQTFYHSSASGIGMDLLIRLPLGHTGLTPFVLTGVSIGKIKEVALTDTTVTSHPLGAADTKNDTVTQTTTYEVISGKSEISPEIGLGLAYIYGGAEVRVLGRLQNLNMGNRGQYMTTLSAGLLMHL